MDLPLIVEVIDAPEKIAALQEVISPMVRESMITIEDVEIEKYTLRYLHPLPSDRPVSEVMAQDVITVSPGMPIQQA